ncbi:MAG: cyclic nucleotide-binding domain-containing protein [Planctomycetota bacterium]
MEQRRILATVTEEQTCPMYVRGDGITFSLPGVLLAETSAVCALAIVNLVPVAKELSEKSAGEADATEPPIVKCPGCGTRCSATFKVESITQRLEAGSTMVYHRRMETIREVLSKNPIFQAIPTSHYESLLPLFKERVIAAGTSILREGGPAEGLFIVVDGESEVVRKDATGQEQVIAERGSGECFGEMSLLSGEAATATVRTKSETTFLFVEPRDFRQLLVRFPAIAQALARLLARRVASTSQRVLRELETGIIGKLDMIDAADLVQALSLSGRTGTLVVRREGEDFRLAMKEGQLVSAKLGDRGGTKAFFAFLKWKYGVFRFEPGDPQGEANLSGDTMALLLEGMRQADEATK